MSTVLLIRLGNALSGWLRLLLSMALGADELTVPVTTVLDCPPLRFEVDVHDPEATREPPRPLEVVEQRPREVAHQGHAAFDRGRGRLEVPGQVARALGI